MKYDILHDAERISHELVMALAQKHYEKFRVEQDNKLNLIKKIVTKNNHQVFITFLLDFIADRVGDRLEIVSALLTQLNWTNHLFILSKIKTKQEREFSFMNCLKIQGYRDGQEKR